MTVTSLSFFRFDGWADRLWAFGQMGFARRRLARTEGLGFHKMLGTGTGEGFDPRPNFGVYAILGVWPSLDAARRQIADSRVFKLYAAHAAKSWTVYMEAAQCRGVWDGTAPFQPIYDADDDAPALAVLTRATVKPQHALSFWRQVPSINKVFGAQRGLIFKKGLGEVPLLHQVTFSIWRDREEMMDFAYRGAHGAAIEKVRAGGWFSEELFAQFRVVHAEGAWGEDGASGSVSGDPVAQLTLPKEPKPLLRAVR
ncbi:MAG: spheroidene monooxygenase [Alphaproteobacteria bacterium]|nr:spheroidene monooxygenase [Alphaproteobacteria bacterium]